jgi:hypothetical protein
MHKTDLEESDKELRKASAGLIRKQGMPQGLP